MNKKTKVVLMIIVTFIVCFILIDKVVINRWNILAHITILQKWEQEDINKLAKVINGIFSFITANIMNLVKLYHDNKKEIGKEISKISVFVNNVTCIRKTKRRDGLLEINLGVGTCFVYVNSVLKNVGENTIVECYINDKKLDISSLTKGEDYIFCFKVCREKNERFRKSYTFKLKFRDEKERYYERIVGLEIDEEKRDAKIISKRKQRKRRK